MILPGVTIGAGCVIAAGSVITKDTDPDTIYAGVPAVAKRRCYSQGLVTPRESVEPVL
jgi:acetyltransferase-like isoleucine patch superfamily enzyme